LADAGAACVQHYRQRGADQHRQRRHQDGDGGHLDLEGLDLLAQVFRRAADHQAGDEDADQGEHDHAVEAGADAAEDHFTELHQPHRHQAAERRVGVVHRIDRAVGGGGGGGGPEGRVDDAEAGFLAFHVAAGLQLRCLCCQAQSFEQRVAGLFGPDADR
jgi:hypothetical protein